MTKDTATIMPPIVKANNPIILNASKYSLNFIASLSTISILFIEPTNIDFSSIEYPNKSIDEPNNIIIKPTQKESFHINLNRLFLTLIKIKIFKINKYKPKKYFI